MNEYMRGYLYRETLFYLILICTTVFFAAVFYSIPYFVWGIDLLESPLLLAGLAVGPSVIASVALKDHLTG